MRFLLGRSNKLTDREDKLNTDKIGQMIGKYSHLMPQLVIVGESQAGAVRHRPPFLTATTTAMITRVAMLSRSQH